MGSATSCECAAWRGRKGRFVVIEFAAAGAAVVIIGLIAVVLLAVRRARRSRNYNERIYPLL